MLEMDNLNPTTDMYVTLSYEQYKAFEAQAKAFEETVHGEGTAWYHKSMRLNVGHITFEIHGPNVKARVEQAGQDAHVPLLKDKDKAWPR